MRRTQKVVPQVRAIWYNKVVEEIKPFLGLITFLCVQSAAAIWWASRVTTTLEFVRRRLDEVAEGEDAAAKLHEQVIRLEEAVKKLEEGSRRH